MKPESCAPIVAKARVHDATPFHGGANVRSSPRNRHLFGQRPQSMKHSGFPSSPTAHRSPPATMRLIARDRRAQARINARHVDDVSNLPVPAYVRKTGATKRIKPGWISAKSIDRSGEHGDDSGPDGSADDPEDLSSIYRTPGPELQPLLWPTWMPATFSSITSNLDLPLRSSKSDQFLGMFAVQFPAVQALGPTGDQFTTLQRVKALGLPERWPVQKSLTLEGAQKILPNGSIREAMSIWATRIPRPI